MEKDLFSIPLTSNGRYWLEKFRFLAGFLFLLSILTTIVGLFNFYLRIRYFGLDFSKDSIIKSQVWASRIYGLFFHILFPIQVYFYFRFAQENKESTEKQNDENFNGSFKFLFLNAQLSLITFSLNLVYVIFETYTNWILAHRIP
jgi:hypothetical protein